jgi:hypothetical protein
MATYTVTTLDDEPFAGTETPGSPDGTGLSLREALALANSNGTSPDSIVFDAALSGETLFLTNGELLITDDITIDGDIDADGSADIQISADSSEGAADATSRVFTIDGPAIITATLNGLVIRNGSAVVGAGIRVVDETLVLTNSTVMANVAGAHGGAIHSSGVVQITNSTLSGNQAGTNGGAVYSTGASAAVTLDSSTVSGNTAGYAGGGIFNNLGAATLTNTTVAGNAADYSGGIHNDSGTLALTSSTVSGNLASIMVGGIWNNGSSAFTTLTNSIVTGNYSLDPGNDDVQSFLGVVTLTGGNIITDARFINGALQQTGIALTDIFASVTTNAIGVTSGTLASNGGPVQTIALSAAAANPALDAGDDTLAPATDARGGPRDDAAGVANNGGNISDLGAFELQATPASLVVTTLSDSTDNDYGGSDIVAETADGGGLSLREALALANADPDANTITFDASLAGGTLTLGGSELSIFEDVSITGDIDGDHRADILIDGNGLSGVFHIFNGETTLDGLNITGGDTSFGGGGVFAATAVVTTISNSFVFGNYAAQQGGGILNGGSMTIINTTVAGNEAGQGGGGFMNFATANVVNTTFSGNLAAIYGGGFANDGTATLVNSTVSGNAAYNITPNYGGGIHNSETLTIVNSIVAGNDADNGAEIFTSIVSSGTTLYSGVNVIGTGSDTNATDHIIQTPTLGDLFAHVDDDFFTDVTSGVLADNGGAVPTIAIKIGGVAQDAGTDAAAVYDDDFNGGTADIAIPTDARGFGRVDGARVDIGAFEQQAGQSFVVTTLQDELDTFDPNATLADFGGAGDLSLREALVLTGQDPTSIDTITFSAALIGGSTLGVDDGNLLLIQGDLVVADNVIIDGDVNGDDTPDITVDAQGNSRVFTMFSGTSTLNGLTLTGGYATVAGGAVTVGYFGLGIADVTISNSVIDGNEALYGGGIAVDIGGTLHLNNSAVTNNSAYYAGGGVANRGTLTVAGSRVASNTSGYVGGGIFNIDTLTIVNSTLADNRINGSAGPYGPLAGAGLYNDGDATVVSTTISGNSGAEYGGGIYNSSSLTLTNATIANNSATYGGGLYDSTCGCADTTLINSTLSGNFAAEIGGGIYHADGALTLTNTILAGNGAGYSNPDFITAGGTVTLAGRNLFSRSDAPARPFIDFIESDLTKIFATPATVDPDGIPSNGDEFQAGLLANNGGLVQTIAIRALGGVAFNGGDTGALPPDSENLDGDADTSEPLPFDARGLPRVELVNVDIGAFEVQNNAPAVAANTGLTLNEGASVTITSAALDFNDAEHADSAITYTITSVATNGTLARDGVTLGLGSTFTQLDIINVLIAYTHNGGETTSASFGFSVSDGVAPAVTGQSFAFTINPVNDAPTHASLPIPPLQIEANTATPIAGLSIADPDAGAGTLTTTLSVTHGTLTAAAIGGAGVTGSGTDSITITGTVAQINTALGSGNIVFEGTHDYFGSDTLHVVTDDGGNSGLGGPLSDTDDVAINLNTLLAGTEGPDSFTALPGNERIDADHGIDTITFGFNLVDATVIYSGNLVIIDGPGGSHTVTSGFERYVFTDGTVDNNDGNPLVDDLFYYSQHHDVWNAHVDAEVHYAGWGWQERRDPNAFFSTTTYLALNQDVKAAGVNPIDHWHASGWTEGRLPSFAFDPHQYLVDNPDVAAAHVDPLWHFLEIGASEGRQPTPVAELIAGNGFDAVYYLQQNPDVAAAEAEPFQHFQTTGWHEGRNPNALFDVNGYLTNYTDVAAAGINPLDHYHLVGWTEGRDPSLAFDTASYLAANPDVEAAHVDPLKHFLQFGLHEGRTAFADGTWG